MSESMGLDEFIERLQNIQRLHGRGLALICPKAWLCVEVVPETTETKKCVRIATNDDPTEGVPTI